jgi:hypothetical protein
LFKFRFPLPPTSGSHNAHQQQDQEVTIYYRFHPYHGAVVTLHRRISYQGEQLATLVYPDGALRRIPAWMIEPQAAQLELHEPPRFSEQCLKELRHVLDVALSVLDRSATADAAGDGGAA